MILLQYFQCVVFIFELFIYDDTIIYNVTDLFFDTTNSYLKSEFNDQWSCFITGNKKNNPNRNEWKHCIMIFYIRILIRIYYKHKNVCLINVRTYVINVRTLTFNKIVSTAFAWAIRIIDKIVVWWKKSFVSTKLQGIWRIFCISNQRSMLGIRLSRPKNFDAKITDQKLFWDEYNFETKRHTCWLSHELFSLVLHVLLP